MTNTFYGDYSFGEEQEQRLLPILNDFFELELELTQQQDRFDYIDKNKKVLIELKSRRVNKNKYSTTIVPERKYLCGVEKSSQGWRIIYVFNFIDCISYIEPDPNKEYVVRRQGRRDRGKLEYVNHINFNISDLTDIQDN